MNVLRLSFLIVPLLLSGCGTLKFWGEDEVKPIQVQKQEVARPPLNLPMPDPIKITGGIRFIVITRETSETVFSDLVTEQMDPIVFALTDQGYMELSMTIAELRNLIATQRSIITRYKEYYEPEKKPEKTN